MPSRSLRDWHRHVTGEQAATRWPVAAPRRRRARRMTRGGIRDDGHREVFAAW